MAWKLEIFYYFILLGIFPLILQYFIYSLSLARTQLYNYLFSIYDEVRVYDENSEYKKMNYDFEEDSENEPFGVNPKAIYHNHTVSLQKFMDIKLKNFYEDYPTILYYGIPCAREEVIGQYEGKNNKNTKELMWEDFDSMHQEFYRVEPLYFQLNLYLDWLTFVPFNYKLIYLQIVIYLTYLFCWIYIVYMSFHTLRDWSITSYILELLHPEYLVEDPFTQLKYDKTFQNGKH